MVFVCVWEVSFALLISAMWMTAAVYAGWTAEIGIRR